MQIVMLLSMLEAHSEKNTTSGSRVHNQVILQASLRLCDFRDVSYNPVHPDALDTH